MWQVLTFKKSYRKCKAKFLSPSGSLRATLEPTGATISPSRPLAWTLHWLLRPIIICPGPWPILQQSQIWSVYAVVWERVKIVDFFRNCCSELSQSWYMQSPKWWSYMSIKGQGHSLMLAQGHSYPKLKLVFLGNYWAIWIKFQMKAFGSMENVILFNSFWSYDEDGCHAHTCTRWITPIKIFLLWNQLVDCLETWYVTYAMQAYCSLFEWWPRVDLDLLYPYVKFCCTCILYGKKENYGFFRNIGSLWSITDRCSQLNE